VPAHDLGSGVVAAWRTNNAVTIDLVRHLPLALWSVGVHGARGRDVRAIVAHLHNARCGWLKTLGSEHGIAVPARVDRRRVNRRELAAALGRSGNAMASLLELGVASGGQLPPSRGYVWRNLALDVAHVLTYFVAHEAHHRGQIVMVARQTGVPLSSHVIGGLWQWKPRVAARSR